MTDLLSEAPSPLDATIGTVVGLGLLGFLIFDRLIWRFGAIGALVVVFGILMVIAYRADRKKQHQYDDA